MNLDFSYQYDTFLVVSKEGVTGINKDEEIPAYCFGTLSDVTKEIAAANLDSFYGSVKWGMNIQHHAHPDTLWIDILQTQAILSKHGLRLSGRILRGDKDDIYMFLADESGISRKKASFVDI